ncbi:MAG: adenylate/guanylate cyclase domain-containing protein [Alphaproteobacteria bacterium]
MRARVRLVSGLILFTYVLTHLLNHALGIVSLAAMEAGLEIAELLWRGGLGTLVLYSALVAHIGTVLAALFRRRDLRMSAREIVQIVLGLAIPFLLARHAVGTRAVHEMFGIDDGYTYVLLNVWVFVPRDGALQVLLLVVAWGHACLGLYAWLRLKPFYPRWQPYLYAGAIVVPLLALAGFLSGAREVARLAADPAWLEAVQVAAGIPTEAAFDFFVRASNGVMAATAALVVVVAAGREVRRWLEHRQGLVALTYPGGREVRVPRGTSVLEASRRFGIPHASVCGGRGRCSTCRVRVGRGGRDLPAASADEQRVLHRISAPPNVRLACQLRPIEAAEVTPLLPPDASARHGFAGQGLRAGAEREVVVLFADIRGFTRIAEHKLPYDVVFVLNRYFASMGAVIDRDGGHLDKFIGDGVMALFGLMAGPAEGCRQALRAARDMMAAIAALNEALAGDLDTPLRIGVGIHVGPAIVGEMGYAHAMSVTAVGDSVNTASRLESMTKDFDAELVVSEDVARGAGIDLSSFPSREVAVRGRREPLTVRVVADVTKLPVMP